MCNKDLKKMIKELDNLLNKKIKEMLKERNISLHLLKKSKNISFLDEILETTNDINIYNDLLSLRNNIIDNNDPVVLFISNSFYDKKQDKIKSILTEPMMKNIENKERNANQYSYDIFDMLSYDNTLDSRSYNDIDMKIDMERSIN